MLTEVPPNDKRLVLRHVTKAFPGVLANDDISLSVAPGEIHAILGENGAGKSTLMKIIYGAMQADHGAIIYDGQDITHHSPAESRSLGIEMVYQHFSLFETVTVAENIALCLPGKLDLKTLAAQIRDTAQRYGLNVDPGRAVMDLSVGERQQVEILRCLLQEPRLLILDEPTSVLPPQAVEDLFAVLRTLAGEGCSILYISHKLDEVRALCETATILRGGKVTGHVDPREKTNAELAVLMVGRDLPHTELPQSTRSAAPLLEVKYLTGAPFGDAGKQLRNVSLEVYGGEVVGIAGVAGNGQSELSAYLSGEVCCAADLVCLDGTAVGDQRPAARRRAGLAYVPEERLGRGAVQTHALVKNGLLTAHIKGLAHKGWIRPQRMRAFTEDIIERFTVKAAGPNATADSLSGGNLQKYILGRELSLAPTVLIAAQPTWGVDVGAAAFVRQEIVGLSRQGAAVLIISEELEELMEVCDRIYVLSNGWLSDPLARSEATLEKIGLLMTKTDQQVSHALAN